MKKNIAMLLSLTLGLTAVGCAIPASETRAESSKELIVLEPPTDSSGAVTMFRLYNPNSGEHFYTKDASEKNNLVKAGWSDEGIGWIAPEKSDTPVYRLYNANAGDHHYTLKEEEKDNLISAGWNFEGIGWYSDDDKTVPLYREYNPNAVTGTHNYTTDKAEHDGLVAAGWKDEGIGWYGIDKKDLEIGDIVILGTYEQDDNSSNGKEEIEWVVLEKEGDKALVISKYALDVQPYNTSDTDVTWETCSLREWLNGTFFNNAFSSGEQDMIQTTTVTADKNPKYDTSPGNDTTDKVFLLSITEVNNYLGSDESRKCTMTKYAKTLELAWIDWANAYLVDDGDYYIADDSVAARWLLRTPGVISGRAAIVEEDGHISYGGYLVDYKANIRPALWINFGS